MKTYEYYCPDSEECAKKFKKGYIANPIISQEGGSFVCEYYPKDCRELVKLRMLENILEKLRAKG